MARAAVAFPFKGAAPALRPPRLLAAGTAAPAAADAPDGLPSTTEDGDGAAYFRALTGMFLSDPDIDEIGFLPALPGPDVDAPALLDATDHKLGVAVPALGRIHMEALAALRAAQRARGGLCGAGRQEDVAWTIDAATRALLVVNADAYYAWSERKRLIVAGAVDARRELRFLDVLFTKHRKSSDAWSHRAWVLQQVMRGATASDDRAEVIAREVEACARVAHAYPRCYFAWTHRHRVALFMTLEQLLGELSATEEWARTHLADFSALHHRQVILQSLLDSALPRGAGAGTATSAAVFRVDAAPDAAVVWELLRADFALTAHLIETYPGHEAHWCHRRFLLDCVVAAGVAVPNALWSSPTSTLTLFGVEWAPDAPPDGDGACGCLYRCVVAELSFAERARGAAGEAAAGDNAQRRAGVDLSTAFQVWLLRRALLQLHGTEGGAAAELREKLLRCWASATGSAGAGVGSGSAAYRWLVKDLH